VTGMQAQVAEFHRAIGDALARDPEQVARLRIAMLTEEYVEAMEAIASGDRAQIARELADLMYVIYGTACMYGIDLGAAFDAVHESNMSKIGPGGPVVRSDGKVLKGPCFRPPDMLLALSPVPERIPEDLVSTSIHDHGAA
jgi:predicted HAD superfamily Cof-like phosphohydrolase